MTINEKYLSGYDASKYEAEIYKAWEDSGYFNPDNLKNTKGKFSIILPPPNANGDLHAGHGSDFVLKDIMGRYHRMLGKKVLLLPGSDHAGFETQGTFEKKLAKEGRSRFGMKREDLYNEIYDFVMEHKSNMVQQVKRLGTSCDWSREKFTLDPEIVLKVQDTFERMYRDGMIYRGKRSIHWNPKFKTSLAEIETKFEDRTEPFYYLKFGPFEIATSRPETKLTDKFVVVHPDDPRYKNWKEGDTFELEWINGKITATVLKDDLIDMEFGTGAMTITPWHDAADFEIAQKHNLEYEQLIDLDGRMMEIAGEEFSGLKTHIAREKVIEKLKEKDLILKVEEKHTHAVRVCERTGVVLEPQLMDQWFVRMKPLTELALKALKEKKISFVSKQFEKVFVHWMENPIDWNISRQIVWGIQIPAWFKNKGEENEEILVQKEKPANKYKKAVLLHAWGSDPKGAFFPWLKKELENSGIEVQSPELPNADNPDFNEWLTEFKKLNIDENTLVIGRSLGATLALAAAQRGHKIGKLIAVCTPLENDAISDFFEDIGEWDFDTIRKNIKKAVIFHSSNDPYISRETSKKISEKLKTNLIELKNADHFTGEKYSEILNCCDLWEQDGDTFDTWFSSGQWPLLTLGFPDGKDFKEFYPTDVMETGRDLVFKWVPRMIMFGLYLAKDVPFRDIYFHGMILDGKGQKMSKSKGNTLSPIELIDEFGTDAARMSFVVGNTPGKDMSLTKDKVRAYKKFSNKLWNIARFVYENTEDLEYESFDINSLSEENKKIISDLNDFKKDIGKDIEEYRMYMAAEKGYHYVWHKFADKILETSKEVLQNEKSTEKEKNEKKYILLFALEEVLKIMHPFIPFVTEEIWKDFPKNNKDLLMVEKW